MTLNLPAEKKRRVPVNDDNRALHDDFRKILSPATTGARALEATEAALFGESTVAVLPTQFEVDLASQGQEGVLLAARALRIRPDPAQKIPGFTNRSGEFKPSGN